jgi:hypothetical protein
MSILQITAITLSWAVFGLVQVSSSGCGMSAAQVRDRELCYNRAETVAQDRVDRECSGSFRTCPVADDIMEQLRRAQEACP